MNKKLGVICCLLANTQYDETRLGAALSTVTRYTLETISKAKSAWLTHILVSFGWRVQCLMFAQQFISPVDETAYNKGK